MARGKKSCPRCNIEVGARKKICDYGYHYKPKKTKKRRKLKNKKREKTGEELVFSRKMWKHNTKQVQKIAKNIIEGNYKIVNNEDIFNNSDYCICDEASNLIQKIEKRIEVKGAGSVSSYLKLIVDHEEFAAELCINPTRQSIFQKRFFDMMKEISDKREEIEINIRNTRKRKGRLFLNPDGEVTTIKKGDERDIDIIMTVYRIKGIKGKDKVIYISHKMINNDGSSQGDQYKEVLNFLKCAAKNDNKNQFFILAYEGNHFSDNRIKELKKYCSYKVLAIEAKQEQQFGEIVDKIINT